MSVITDACSLVNAVKIGLTPAILLDPCMQLCAGPVVMDEVWGNDKPLAGMEIPHQVITPIQEDISGDELVDFMEMHKLGPGESECIILAQRHGFIFLSDDKRARNVASELIGADRVVGTFGMALAVCKSGVLASADVVDGYMTAIGNGAFLPKRSREGFLVEAGNCRAWPCGPDCIHTQGRPA